MKKPASLYITICLFVAVVTHVGLLYAAPYLYMKAILRPFHIRYKDYVGWIHTGKVGAKTRLIVRPSADYVYSFCFYDLSKGVYRVRATTQPTYVSVAAYASNSDNFFVLNNTTDHGDIEFYLVSNRSQIPVSNRSQIPVSVKNVAVSPSMTGVMMTRRLASTNELFAEADRARKSDICEILPAAMALNE
jgi:uncharacterized membrane protein